MISIHDAKITFVAGACFADHLWSGDRPDPVPWYKPFYVEEYNQLRAGEEVDDYDFAWYPSQKSSFWRYYLGSQALDGVCGPDAWEAFVPFRLVNERPCVETNLRERVVIDAYGYELGVVVAITVQPFKRAAARLDDFVDRLRVLRDDSIYLYGDGREEHTVAEVLSLLLKYYRKDYYGGDGASVPSYEPLSIANVLQAEGGVPDKPVDERLQHCLHAITAWPKDNWNEVELPQLGLSPPFLPLRGIYRLPGDALYAAGRGVAVWRPGLFAPPAPGSVRRRRHTLSCLGHNLVAVAAQAEYFRLVAFAYAAQSKMRDRIDEGRMRSVAHAIDGLLRATGTTYRSAFAQQVLEDGNSRNQVNALLRLADLVEISPTS